MTCRAISARPRPRPNLDVLADGRDAQDGGARVGDAHGVPGARGEQDARGGAERCAHNTTAEHPAQFKGQRNFPVYKEAPGSHPAPRKGPLDESLQIDSQSSKQLRGARRKPGASLIVSSSVRTQSSYSFLVLLSLQTNEQQSRDRVWSAARSRPDLP